MYYFETFWGNFVRMSFRMFLISLIVGTILAWISWFIIIINVDPQQAGVIGFTMFYTSLTLSLIGTLFVISHWFRLHFLKKKVLLTRIHTSLRQAMFFTVLIVCWMILKSQNISNFWNTLLLILILTVLEFFFLSRQKRTPVLHRQYE